MLRAKSLQSCLALGDLIDCSSPGACAWDSSGKNTGVGGHALLQGIFLMQGSNLHILHWQVDYLPLSHQESHNVPKAIKVIKIVQ